MEANELIGRKFRMGEDGTFDYEVTAKDTESPHIVYYRRVGDGLDQGRSILKDYVERWLLPL